MTPTIYTNAKDLTSARQELETYWKVALRSHEWASQKVFEDYKFDKKHTICSLIDRQDLILEVAYFCADSGLFKTKVIFCEIDGDNKTTMTQSKTREKEGADITDDTEEDHGKKKLNRLIH